MHSSIHSNRSREGPQGREGGRIQEAGSFFNVSPGYRRIDSSSFDRSERSDGQIVRKSWNRFFHRRKAHAARRLINMSLLSRSSSNASYAAHALKRNVISIGEHRQIFFYAFFPGVFSRLLYILYAVLLLFIYGLAQKHENSLERRNQKDRLHDTIARRNISY